MNEPCTEKPEAVVALGYETLHGDTPQQGNESTTCNSNPRCHLGKSIPKRQIFGFPDSSFRKLFQKIETTRRIRHRGFICDIFSQIHSILRRMNTSIIYIIYIINCTNSLPIKLDRMSLNGSNHKICSSVNDTTTTTTIKIIMTI
jgi:hypothetical protein